jgi:thiamine-phosphate pyrophosphorylase
MSRLRGLYAVTPQATANGPPLPGRVAQAIAGGARLIQYRDKQEDPEKRLSQAKDLLRICRAAAVPLIVNDDLELAAGVRADGVHLGKNDAEPLAARERLGPTAIIGVSCYDQIDRAIRAERAGADYVAFGRFYASNTKPLAVQATPDLLRRARKRLSLPLVAIGGITPENGRSLISAGADMLAVVDAVFGRPDVRAAANAINQLFPTEVSIHDPLP